MRLIKSSAFAAVLLLSVLSHAETPSDVEVGWASLPDAPGTVGTEQLSETAPVRDDAATSAAQQPAALPPCETGVRQKQTMTSEQLKAEESQYIAVVVPNFNTVFGTCAPPLKPSQKLSLVYHSAVAPFTIGLDVLLGGWDEISGAHNGYGWGPAGYFKRAGAEYADTVSAGVIGNGLLPILFHQDPRFFQMGAGHPFAKRVWHAAQSDFVCPGDNGRLQFNASNIFGNLISGTLSNAYYPANERGAGLTLKNAAKVTLEGSFGSQILEFAPDLTALAYRAFHHGNRDPKKLLAPTGSTPHTAMKPYAAL